MPILGTGVQEGLLLKPVTYPWAMELYDQAVGITDKAARYKVLAQAEKVLLDTYLTAPIAAAPQRNLVRSNVKGWVDNPTGWHGTQFMSLE